MKRPITIALGLVAAAAAVGAGMLAADWLDDAQDTPVADLARSKVSLADAIGTAQSHAGGRAFRAELEHEHGAAVFSIEVLTAAGQVLEVEIDAADGKVRSSKPPEGIFSAD